MQEVFEDPQVRHLGLATPVPHPRMGELMVQRVPVTLSRTPGSVRPRPETGPAHRRGPGEIGYSAEEIAALHRDGAV